MKLGIHAMAWCKNWDNTALYTIDRVKAMGLDFIEIPLISLEGFDVKATRDKLRAAGLEAVTSTLIINPEHDITNFDPKVRAAGTDYLKQCVQYTSEIGANFFSGVIYGLHLKSHPARPSEELIQMVAVQLKEVARYAGELGVTIGIEPINRHETFMVNTCKQALALKHMIGEPNVKIHLDTYHMNIEEKSLAGAVRDAGKDLGHIHLNENDWGIPGTGHLDWDGVFRALREIDYKGYASLECVIDFEGGGVWRQLAPDSATFVEEGIRFLAEKRENYWGR